MPCVWEACINPPTMNTLKHDWDGTAVAFNTPVTYSCNRSDEYFVQDRNLTGFDVFCRAGGVWQEPFPWPICVPSNYKNYRILIE